STNIALARGESLRVAITNIGPRATQRRRAPIQSCSLAIELAGLVVACHLLVELGYSSSSLHGSDTGTLSTGSRLRRRPSARGEVAAGTLRVRHGYQRDDRHV